MSKRNGIDFEELWRIFLKFRTLEGIKHHLLVLNLNIHASSLGHSQRICCRCTLMFHYHTKYDGVPYFCTGRVNNIFWLNFRNWPFSFNFIISLKRMI